MHERSFKKSRWHSIILAPYFGKSYWQTPPKHNHWMEWENSLRKMAAIDTGSPLSCPRDSIHWRCIFAAAASGRSLVTLRSNESVWSWSATAIRPWTERSISNLPMNQLPHFLSCHSRSVWFISRASWRCQRRFSLFLSVFNYLQLFVQHFLQMFFWYFWWFWQNVAEFEAWRLLFGITSFLQNIYKDEYNHEKGTGMEYNPEIPLFKHAKKVRDLTSEVGCDTCEGVEVELISTVVMYNWLSLCMLLQ